MKRSSRAVLFLGLFLLFLAALLPIQQAYAANITSVSVTVTAPEAGAKPSYKPGLPSGAHYGYGLPTYNEEYYQNGVSWYDETDCFDLEPGKDTFKANHFYSVIIYLAPKSGYQFSDDMDVRVNGNLPSWIVEDNGELYICYTFPESKQPISAVSATFTAPKAGARPDYSPVLHSGAKYELQSNYFGDYESTAGWYDATDNCFLSPTTGRFKAGHEYEVSFYLEPKVGYVFTEITTAKVNGHAAFVDSHYDWCCVSYLFPKTESAAPTLSSVSFSKTKATVGQNVTVTAATSTDVTKLSMYNGSTLAKSWTGGYTDSGTARTWKVTYAFVAEGAKTLTFKGTDANGTATAGKTASITITAKPALDSVSFSKTKATVGQNVTVTAATSTNVTKLSMYNGSTLAKSWTSGYTDSGTTRTWKVTYAFVAEGAKTLTFKGTDANGAVTAGKKASITITAKPALNSVSFSKTKATVGQNVTVTAATSTNVTKLSMYNGSMLAKSWTSGYTDSGTTRTWKVTYAFTAAGAKTLTFKGTDANGAVTAGKTASITITAKPTLSSVSFSKTTVAVGKSVTITAVTSTTVTKLCMYNGSALAKSWTSGYTDSGTTRTWKVTYAFVGTGAKTLTFKGFDANGVASGSKTASITVTSN